MLRVGGLAASFEEFENEGGTCPECGHGVDLWTCCECGTSAWVIECAHRVPTAWLRRGRRDGSAASRLFCGDCADVLPSAPLPA